MRCLSRYCLAILVGLLLCSGLSALAQTTPSWKVTYSYSGSTTVTASQNTTMTWTAKENRGYRGYQFPYGAAGGTITSAGQMTATLKWVDAQGNAAPNPPALVNIRETSYAEATAHPIELDITEVSASSDANNGETGDQVVKLRTSGTINSVMNGRHYLTVDGSSGTITRTVNVSGNMTVSGSAGGQILTKFILTIDVLNHAHPCNMRLNPAQPITDILKVPYALEFQYLWDSTSGKKSTIDIPLHDLDNCTVGFIITFSGAGQRVQIGDNTFFQPQNPPLGGDSILDPTISNFDAFLGVRNIGSTAPDPIKPYSQVSFTGKQVLRFHCYTCMNDDEFQDLLGPIDIVHSIIYDPLTQIWSAVVTANGYSSSKTLP